MVCALLALVPWHVRADPNGSPHHRRIPNLRGDEVELLLSGSGPEAFTYRSQVVPKPQGDASATREPPLRADHKYAQPDGRLSDSPVFRPDRVTKLYRSRHQPGTFTPSISPFRRLHVLDRVAEDQTRGGDPVLAVSSRARVAVPVHGAQRPGHDLFWGTVTLDFTSGRTIALPSVSPASRILSLSTEPPGVALVFERDAADNMSVSLASGVKLSSVKIVYLMDAPTTYFNRPTIAAVATDVLKSFVVPVPDPIRAEALRLAQRWGLRPNTRLERTLSVLTEHFRSFEESREPPANTGRILNDLTLGKKGVCRHRAFAFMIIANALGIPTRFVMNETHAWVEVMIPDDRGVDRDPAELWMRIDLGGALGGQGRAAPLVRYQPRHPDPLPRPAAYQRALRGSGSRGKEPQALQAQPAPEELVVSLTSVFPKEGFRGQPVRVVGQVRGPGGEAAAGVAVVVFAAGARPEDHTDGVTLGRLWSNPEGEFSGTLTVPADLSPGDYDLQVRAEDGQAP